jgi:ABC-type lipoprotein export system ATPase subunit
VTPAPSIALEARALAGRNGAALLQLEHATFARGAFHVLIGATDSGHELLLRLLGLLEPPVRGEILLDGEALPTLDADACLKVRERRLGYVFSSPFLLSAFSVIENVAMPLFKVSSLEIDDARERSDIVMGFAGLCELSQTPCSELPAFAQHRVSLARALVNHPAVLFVESLDATLADEDLRLFSILLRQAAIQFDVAVIASASPDFATDPADRVFHVAGGTVSCPPQPFPTA